MKKISRLDENAKQSLSFITEENKTIDFYFYFMPTQNSWFFDMTYGSFVLKGQRLCAHPNLLTKYHNIIDIGLNVETSDGFDPWRITDFKTGYCEVSVLNKTEVAEIERFLNGEQA